jgi:hypothetical protein
VPPHPALPVVGVAVGEDLAETPPKYRDRSLWLYLRLFCAVVDASALVTDVEDKAVAPLLGFRLGLEMGVFALLVSVEEHRHVKVWELDSVVVDCAVGLSRL